MYETSANPEEHRPVVFKISTDIHMSENFVAVDLWYENPFELEVA